MERRRLWQLSCPVKDAALWTPFEIREALDVFDRTGLELELPAGTSRDVPHATACAPRHACHSPNPFSPRMEALLDEPHEGAMEAVEAAAPDWIRRDLAEWPVSFAGLACALARSWLDWRPRLEGPRTPAFGKVEPIEVAR